MNVMSLNYGDIANTTISYCSSFHFFFQVIRKYVCDIRVNKFIMEYNGMNKLKNRVGFMKVYTSTIEPPFLRSCLLDDLPIQLFWRF